MILSSLMLALDELFPEYKGWVLEERCVSAHLMRLLPHGYKRGLRGRSHRIIVHVCSALPRKEIIYCQGFCERFIRGDPWEITKKPDPIRRKEWYLHHLLQGVLLEVEDAGWDKQLFLDAAAQIRAGGYINRWLWGKPLRNLNRTYQAVAECNHEWDAFTLTLKIMDRHRRVCMEKEIVRCEPSEFIYHSKLGKLHWADHKTLQMRTRKQDVMAELTV